MNVAQRDEEQVPERWREKSERGGKKRGEGKCLDPALFNSQSVDISCWPHTGCTGLAEKVLAADEETARGVRGRSVRGN